MNKVLSGLIFFLCFFPLNFTHSQSDYYRQEEVKFYNGKIEFAGTFTIPFSKMKHPALILISGDGAHGRNYNHQGFEMFKAAADYFTRSGFAVLRFDERDTGGPTGGNSKATIKDLSGDILAAIKFLKTREEIDAKHIGLCGHGEGGIVAMFTASRTKDVDFLVIMSGSTLPGDKFLISKLRNTLKTSGVQESLINEEVSVREKFFSLVKKGKSRQQIKKELKEYLLANYAKRSEAFKKEFPDKEKYVRNTTNTLCRDFNNSAFRFFLNYDPAKALEKINCPLLATFGGKDILVSAEENKKALNEAFMNRDSKAYEIKIFPEADHFYEPAINGHSQRNEDKKREFIPGYIEYVSEWIRNLFPQESPPETGTR